MAATFRTSVAGGGTSGTVDRTAVITPVVGDLFVVFCEAAVNSNVAPTCSDNNGGTYTRVLAALHNASGSVLSVFVRNQKLVNTTSTTVTVATGLNDAAEIVVVAVAGMHKVGAAAIRSSGSQANQNAGGTPAPVLNQAALTRNLTMTAVGAEGATGANGTSNASWTERQDIAQLTPTAGIQVATRDNGFTGTTITYGGTTATAFASAAIELNGDNDGVLAVTDAGDTLTAAGAVRIAGTESTTEAGDVIAATATVSSSTIAGAASMTEGADSDVATGAVVIAASSLNMEGSDTSTGTGAVRIAGTESSTEAGDTGSATGASALAGSASPTEQGDSAAGTGAVRIAGTSVGTEAGDTAGGTGTLPLAGQLASNEAGDTGAGTGALLGAGSLSTVEGEDVAQGAGALIDSGSGASTEAEDQLAAQGATPIAGGVSVKELDDEWEAISRLSIAAVALAPEASDQAQAQGVGGTSDITGTLIVVEENDVSTGRSHASCPPIVTRSRSGGDGRVLEEIWVQWFGV